MANRVLTPPCLLSFPALFTPKPDDAGKLFYSATLIFSAEAQKTPEYRKMMDAVITAAKTKFGSNVNLKALKMPFSDGASKADKWAGFTPDSTYINVKSEQKPDVVDAFLKDIYTPGDAYPGCLVRAELGAFGWDWKGKKGVSLGLNHIQILSKDEKKFPRIDGRKSGSQVFSVYGDGDSGDEQIPF